MDKSLFVKFKEYISIELREGGQVLVIKVGSAIEIDIDELLSLKYIWEDYSLTETGICCDPVLISGAVSFSKN